MANDNTGYKPLLQRMMPNSSLYNNEKAPNAEYNSPLNSIFKQFSDASYYGSKEDKAAGNSSMSNLGEDISNAMPGGKIDPRQFARTFDPTSNTDVMKMQGMLGVKEDGILGPKTLGALRELQGVSPQEAPEDYSGSSEESQWADEEGYGGDFGDSGYDSYGPPAEAPMMGPEARGPKMPGVKGWLQRAMPGGQSGYGDPNAPNSSQEISDFNFQGGNESSEPRLNRQETEFAGDDGVSEFDPEGYSEELQDYSGDSDEYDDPYGYSEEEEEEYGVSEEGGINSSQRIMDQYNKSKRFTNKY